MSRNRKNLPKLHKVPFMGIGWGMAMAVQQAREQKIKEEYAREHDGQKIPRRKKSADNGDQRAGR